MRVLVNLVFCSALVLSLPWTARACKCAGEPTLLKAFQTADVVVQATLLKKLKTSSSSTLEIAYSAKIVRTWKGCGSFKCTDIIKIKTTTEGATCGVLFLKLGSTYLFSGSLGSSNKSISINSCGFQAPWKGVNVTEVGSLSTTYSNCSCNPKSCGPTLGLPNYLCPDGVTVAGPGPCTYNQKLGTCAWEIRKCPTCQQQSDCGRDQYCSAGVCRATGTCANAIDCLNPQNQYISVACAATPQCKSTKCSVDCKQPCPNGAPFVNCFADPCQVTKCNVSTSCVSNYCGGCNALFFNSSGYQVCTASS